MHVVAVIANARQSVYIARMSTNLLAEIEQFLEETGMSSYSLGYRSVRNGRLVDRLRLGRRVWPETQQAVRAYMRSTKADTCRKQAKRTA